MKKFYIIVLFVSNLMVSAHADDLKQFCQDSVSMMIQFKAKSIFEKRGIELVEEKSKAKLKKWPLRKEEIMREKHGEIGMLKRVRPLGLCEDKILLEELKEVKKYGEERFLNCYKSRNPKATLNSLDIDGSVEPSKTLEADIRAAYLKVAETTLDTLSDVKLTEACLQKRVNQIKASGKELMGSEGGDFCKKVVYQSNHISSLKDPCKIKEEETTFTDDQLFKCSMGEDPLKNCPSPDPLDVKAWKERKKDQKGNVQRPKMKSHAQACEKGNKKACRSMNIIRNRAFSN